MKPDGWKDLRRQWRRAAKAIAWLIRQGLFRRWHQAVLLAGANMAGVAMATAAFGLVLLMVRSHLQNTLKVGRGLTGLIASFCGSGLGAYAFAALVLGTSSALCLYYAGKGALSLARAFHEEIARQALVPAGPAPGRKQDITMLAPGHSTRNIPGLYARHAASALRLVFESIQPLLTSTVAVAALVWIDPLLTASLLPLAVVGTLLIAGLSANGAELLRAYQIKVSQMGRLVNTLLRAGGGNSPKSGDGARNLLGPNGVMAGTLDCLYAQSLLSRKAQLVARLLQIFSLAWLVLLFGRNKGSTEAIWASLLAYLVALRFAWSHLSRLAVLVVEIARFLPSIEICAQSAGSLPAAGRKQGLNWIDISSQPLCRQTSVQPGGSVLISGRIRVKEGEKRSSALVSVRFEGAAVPAAQAGQLGLSYSKRAGFYRYLPTDTPGEHPWSVRFKVPEGCDKVNLRFMPWCARHPVAIALEGDPECLPDPAREAKRAFSALSRILASKGAQEAESFADQVQLPPEARAKLYRQLADSRNDPEARARLLLKAFKTYPQCAAIVGLVQAAASFGLLDTASQLIDALERKNCHLTDRQHKAIGTARGLICLWHKLPAITNSVHLPLQNNRHTVTMFLYTSLPHQSNGYAIRSHCLLEALVKSGRYKVRPVTRPGFPQEAPAEDETRVGPVCYQRLGGPSDRQMPLDRYITAAADRMERLLEQQRPAVVHAASDYRIGLPALLAARRLGIAFVYEIRGFWEVTRASLEPGWQHTESFALQSSLETFVASRADRVVAITGQIRQELIRRGVAGDLIEVIPNCVDPNAFKPGRGDPGLARSLPLPGAPTVGYVGSIVAYEGLDLLLQALAILKKRSVRFNLLIVGDGPALEDLVGLARDLGLEENILAPGRVAPAMVSAYYSLIDIAPFPRKALPVCELVSPLKPLEAMAMEKAVIVSDVAALRDLVKDGETGLVFKKDDAHDLARALELLTGDRSLCRRLGTQARRWVLGQRSSNQMARQMERVYHAAFKANAARVNRRLNNARQMRPVTLLLYGDIDPGTLDGSAIWLASMAEMLTGLDQCSLTVLLKRSPPLPAPVLEPLRAIDNLEVLTPANFPGVPYRLAPPDAIRIMEQLHRRHQYDAVILRGDKCLELAAKSPVLKGSLWSYPVASLKSGAKSQNSLTALVQASSAILCQTVPMARALATQVPGAAKKTAILPPMVPDWIAPGPDDRPVQPGPLKIFYAGQFSPAWGARDMIRIVKQLRQEGLNLELVVYGDKIQSPPQAPSFREEMLQALAQTPGVHWHGAAPRRKVLQQMAKADLGWAFRAPDFERTTSELSTKVIEYAAAGLPPMMVPSRASVALFGRGYPLFATSPEEAAALIRQAAKDRAMVRNARHRAAAVARNHTFSAIRKQVIEPLLSPLRCRPKTPTLLAAGHNLHFAEGLLEQFAAKGWRILIDRWKSHSLHNACGSRQLLARADVVFCEWALGAAVWYSHNLLPFQKLFIRFHRQELDTEFPSKISYEAVSRMVFIAPHIMNQALEKFDLDSQRLALIPNAVDISSFSRPKKAEARFNLGMVGYVPRIKRLDRALDLLEAIRAQDPRYRLFVKGKAPEQYPWMAGRPDEIKYYQDIKARIADSPLLREAVFFEKFDRRMPAWFEKIGWIVSVSEYEGSHLTVAEAMASGATALILSWEGARRIYPPRFCFTTIDQMTNFVLSDTQAAFDKRIMLNRNYARRWDLHKVALKWEKLFRYEPENNKVIVAGK